jgi:hypothetical protein
MVTLAQSTQGARLRAAVDRMHAAQLAALTASGPPGPPGSPESPGAPGPPGVPESHPVVGRRDAFGAERQLLAQVAELGSLLARLGQLAQEDAAAVEVRRRLVALAVACGNTLAELVTLAFEVAGLRDEPGEKSGEDGARSRARCRS